MVYLETEEFPSYPISYNNLNFSVVLAGNSVTFYNVTPTTTKYKDAGLKM